MRIQALGAIQPERRYTSEQVAELVFGRRAEWFYRHRAKLEAKDGFPPPISRIGRPLWQGQVLIDWVGRHSRAAPQGVAANDDAAPAPQANPMWDSVLDHRLAAAE